jgi:two-component system cell cycle sensor histidine kinase/response regulator CckA
VDNIDIGIIGALRAICEFASVDRAYIFRFADNGALMSNSYEWCGEGVDSRIKELNEISTSSYPWLTALLKAGKICYCPKISELPAQAALEKKKFTREGIKSLLCVPLIFSKRIKGFLGFDSLHKADMWTADIIMLLQLAAESIANALERKETEKAIRENQEKFQKVFYTSRDPSAISGVDDGIFKEVNEAFLELLGFKREEVIGKSSKTLGTWVNLEDRDAVLTTLRRDGYCKDHEVQVRKRNGEIIYGLFSASIIDLSAGPLLFTMLKDITERKRAEQALKENEKKYRTLFNSAGDAIFQVRLADDKIMDANPRCTELLGFTHAELLTFTIWELHPAEERHRVETLKERVRAYGRFQDVEGFHYTHKNGGAVPVSITYADIRRDKEPFAIIHVRDITERKRTEEALKRSEERLLHSEKMEAIGQLAGGIAHDFNNQLSSIVGYIELLQEAVNDQPELKRYTENIMTATTRASDLTTQLLAFARKGKYQAIPVNVHMTIQEVIQLLKHSIDKRIRLNTSLRAEAPVIRGDPTQLQNALLNLALNARDAMPMGGELCFATRVVNLDKRYCAGSPFELQPGKFIRISVTDMGVGMDDETQKHIFEPFFTTKPDGKGTGMGMAAVYGTVKNHRGAIAVSSHVGRGTTVHLLLPQITGKVSAGTAPAEKSIVAQDSLHVLLIDDEEMIRDVGRAILKSLGYKASLCADGEEAVSLYKKRWKEINLVILDMVMPGMGGMQTFIELKKVNPKIKAILSSGYGADSQVREILNAGVQGFIQKPFRRKDLAEKILQVLSAS